ncbi:phage terminase small subunit P27 family [Staphylococcus saprophyticus]|uniref:phage terminase small subunit P27 family n=1 Tax=Staphylococcus saprophyticus TaxID=29385 RepID=UPI000E6A257D|nr:phage terminase small subunit P27 family [Staphylococcus saprophyticus]RIO25477.1 phage terminase small subunit P27 family [Staphylococcus saprophyticus]
MPRPKKPLDQQKTRRTTQVQEELKATEEQLQQLKPLQKTPPAYLDATAKKEYKRITTLLEELPIADLDLSLVVAYCQTYSNYVQATKHLNKHGLVTETERGTKLSSYYTAQRDSTDRLISLSNKLGLNLDSRMKIVTPKDNKKKDDDVMAGFFDD